MSMRLTIAWFTWCKWEKNLSENPECLMITLKQPKETLIKLMKKKRIKDKLMTMRSSIWFSISWKLRSKVNSWDLKKRTEWCNMRRKSLMKKSKSRKLVKSLFIHSSKVLKRTFKNLTRNFIKIWTNIKRSWKMKELPMS